MGGDGSEHHSSLVMFLARTVTVIIAALVFITILTDQNCCDHGSTRCAPLPNLVYMLWSILLVFLASVDRAGQQPRALAIPVACLCVCLCVCVCCAGVCVCERERESECLCVCVCVNAGCLRCSLFLSIEKASRETRGRTARKATRNQALVVVAGCLDNHTATGVLDCSVRHDPGPQRCLRPVNCMKHSRFPNPD